MGFRTGHYAKVWSVEPISALNTKLRISVSRKNRQTGEYEQDFSGFVNCIGAAAAPAAAKLQEGSKIRLGDVDVTIRYDRKKNVAYTNFKMFSFEVDGEKVKAESGNETETPQSKPAAEPEDDERLPF